MVEDIANSKTKSGELQISPDAASMRSAASALQLIRSLTNISDTPDNLEQSFLDWMRLSKQASTYPEFDYILNNLISQTSISADEEDCPFAAKSIQRFRYSDVFFLNDAGKIVDISKELSGLLELNIGDVVDVSWFQMDQINSVSAPASNSMVPTLEVLDKFGLKRHVVFHSIPAMRDNVKFAGVFIRVTLKEPAIRKLKDVYGLTKSEVDILELAIQRYTPEQISQIRQSKLNTVRTHIKRLNQKLDCSSLNEAIGFSVELSLASETDVCTLWGRQPRQKPKPLQVKVAKDGSIIEYTQHGSPSGKPVVLLHTMEYGFEPTKAMLDAAFRRKLCLYFPRRPGYGESTAKPDMASSAKSLAGFLDALDISDATLIALSASAPMAMALGEVTDRVQQLILVNYGMNCTEKIEFIEPEWLRGLVDMSLQDASTFNIAFNSIKKYLQTFGTHRYYGLVYSGVEADQAFLESNLNLFERSGILFSKANPNSVRLDMTSLFSENENLQRHAGEFHSIVVANSDTVPRIPIELLGKSAEQIGAKFVPVPGGGTHWPFSQPDLLFDLVDPSP